MSSRECIGAEMTMIKTNQQSEQKIMSDWTTVAQIYLQHSKDITRSFLVRMMFLYLETFLEKGDEKSELGVSTPP